MPYCFILRHRVTVLIDSASAARRRFPSNRSEGARDCQPLLFLQVQGVVTVRRSTSLGYLGWEVANPDAGRVREDDRALHGVLQFAHVARPP